LTLPNILKLTYLTYFTCNNYCWGDGGGFKLEKILKWGEKIFYNFKFLETDSWLELILCFDFTL